MKKKPFPLVLKIVAFAVGAVALFYLILLVTAWV